jgi:hypothetical protein
MPIPAKRTESRSRTVQIEGRSWLVQERLLADAPPSARVLIFTSPTETRVTTQYHWLWFGLMDGELSALLPPPRRESAPTSAAETLVRS